MGKKGFVFLPKGFDEVVRILSKKYRIYAPVLKKGDSPILMWYATIL